MFVHFFLTLLVSFHVYAAPVTELKTSAELDGFLQASKAVPKRLYVLKVGATWCGACRNLQDNLKVFPADKKSLINDASWSKIEFDLYEDTVNAFLAKVGVPVDMRLPWSIVFRNGELIGSIHGSDIDYVEKFLKEANAFQPAGESSEASSDPLKLIPKFACGPEDSERAAIFGFSAPASASDATTDDSGRGKLMAYKALFKRPLSLKFFSPEVPAAASTPAPSKYGVLYVPNPFLADARLFNPISSAPEELKSLKYADGNNLRLIFAGHGDPQGIITAFKDKTKPGSAIKLKEPALLTPKALTQSVTEARQANKTVRAVMTQCYAGQFGDAFMPVDENASTGCAVFATLPEKLSQGCYPTTFGVEPIDYLSVASSLKKCDSKQTAVDLHYAVTASAKSFDVPMLTSEFFLLYGGAANYLGSRASTAPAPRLGIVKKNVDAHTVAYVDRLNAQLLKLVRDGKPVRPKPFPYAIMVAENRCGAPWWNSIRKDNSPPQFPEYYDHFRRRINAPEQKNSAQPGLHPYCVQNILFDKFTLDTEIHSLDEVTAAHQDLTDAEKKLDIDDFKPEIRVALLYILPALESLKSKKDLRSFLETVAYRIGVYNTPQARAILKLMKKAPFDPQTFSETVLKNFSDQKVSEEAEIRTSRLAHLVSAALAELQLRDQAKKDAQARKLVDQLEGLRSCEKDLL